MNPRQKMDALVEELGIDELEAIHQLVDSGEITEWEGDALETEVVAEEGL